MRNTQEADKEKRPRGRPPKHTVSVSKESYAYAKTISKQYTELKDEGARFERRMKSLVRLLKERSIKGYPLALGVDERYKDYPLSDGDKSRMAAYIDAKEKVYLIEKGIDQMEDGKWKEIAKDRILMGMRRADVAKKFQVSLETDKRAVRAAVQSIGQCYEMIKEWKAKKKPKGYLPL